MRPDHKANRREALDEHVRTLARNGTPHPQEPSQQTLPGLEAAYAARLGRPGTKVRKAFDACDAVVLGNLRVAAKILGAHGVELQERYQQYQDALRKVGVAKAAEERKDAEAAVELAREGFKAARQVTGALKSVADGLTKVAKLKDELGVNNAPNRMVIQGAEEFLKDLTGDDPPTSMLEGLTPLGSC